MAVIGRARDLLAVNLPTACAVTAWPYGAFAITFAAIGTIPLAPRGEQAYPAAMSFTIGSFLTAVLAAIVGFALLRCPFAAAVVRGGASQSCVSLVSLGIGCQLRS